MREALDVAQVLGEVAELPDRFVVTHCEVVNPSDVGRFAACGVMVQTTPNWAVATKGYEQQLGVERSERQRQPMRSFAESGAVLALGADWPATPGGFDIGMNPFVNIFTAMFRRAPDGLEDALGALRRCLPPDSERLTLEQAIAGYTLGGAKVMGRQQQFGSIEVGKSADMVVIDRDLFAVEPEEIARAEVVATMFEGRVVHDVVFDRGEDQSAHRSVEVAALGPHTACR